MFAENLKYLRKKEKISQVEFAKQFNVATGTIAMWETGKRKPDHDTLNKLANYFKVSIDYLITGNEKSPPNNGVNFERFTEAMQTKGLTEKDIENLDSEKLAAIAEIIKNFKQ